MFTKIIRFDSLPSTNTEAARLAADGADEGTCVVAGEQTAGRGRLQRQWVSPKNAGLYFSIILRPNSDQSAWPLLTLMAAVAVREALFDACAINTDIKWPNDILVNEKKLCGILAETVETAQGRAVVVGIGINLNEGSFPAELDDVATSVETESHHPVDLEVVLERLVSALEKNYQLLNQSNGPEKTLREWSTYSSYAAGKRVSVTETDNSLEGTTRGLERDGALRVETDEGEIRIVRAGDVTAIRAVD
jgi:BirA family biotin operon repressor/biotin-[acetyl-CoA-carboxylase] ligase